MNKSEITTLLKAVAEGKVSPEEATLQLKIQPFEELGFAKVDHHRALRQGVGEVMVQEKLLSRLLIFQSL